MGIWRHFARSCWLISLTAIAVLITSCSSGAPKQPPPPPKKWQNEELAGETAGKIERQYAISHGQCIQRAKTSIPPPSYPQLPAQTNVAAASNNSTVVNQDSAQQQLAAAYGCTSTRPGANRLCIDRARRTIRNDYENAVSAVYVGCMAENGWIYR